MVSQGQRSDRDAAADDGWEPLLQRGYRYALSLTHDEPRAQDLVHDAVLAMLRRDAPRKAAYLITSIRNRYIDAFRRERLVGMEPLADVDEPVDPAHSDPYGASEAVDPERLEQGLATLRANEREALYLSTVEGYSAQEIADLARAPRGTILSRIHRARRKLQSFCAGGRCEVPS